MQPFYLWVSILWAAQLRRWSTWQSYTVIPLYRSAPPFIWKTYSIYIKKQVLRGPFTFLAMLYCCVKCQINKSLFAIWQVYTAGSYSLYITSRNWSLECFEWEIYEKICDMRYRKEAFPWLLQRSAHLGMKISHIIVIVFQSRVRVSMVH